MWFTLWTLQLFALITLLFEPASAAKRVALGLLAAQFIAVVIWQAALFAPGRLTFAAWWLLGSLALVVAATFAAWRVEWRAGALVAPTVLWMAVATALGFALVRLNPGV